MINMDIYKNDNTPIPSFILQRRDWQPLANVIYNQGKLYLRVMKELWRLIDVEPAPANTAPITVTKLTVSILFQIWANYYPKEGLINDNTRGRIVAAITTASALLPVPTTLTQMLADMVANWDERIQLYEDAGKLILREAG